MFVREDSQGLHRFVVVVQGLAHAHQDDIEAAGEKVELPREHAHLPHDFTGGEVAGIPILPVRQNAQRIAHPTWVDRQNVALASREPSVGCPG